MGKGQADTGRAPKTRARIFEAAARLIEREGADALTVRAICEEAQVSNGSFFYQFPTKGALLSYFATEGFDAFVEEHAEDCPSKDMGLSETVLGWYDLYARYCEKVGPVLLSAIYVPGNSSLAPESQHGQLSMLTKAIEAKVRSCQKEGSCPQDEDARAIAGDFCSVVKGSVFEWCICQGSFDLRCRISHILGVYLAGFRG